MNCRHVCKNTEEIATARGSELKAWSCFWASTQLPGKGREGGQKGLPEKVRR